MRLPDSYFAALYAGSVDPWGFQDRWYEARKRAVTLAALPQQRFASGFEPGCSIGVLTAALAPRCDRLLAADVSASALAAAQERLAGAANVRFERRAVPDDWPPGQFDLVVLSELLYYLAGDDLAAVADRAVAATGPGGALVAVHWRHPVADYPTTGDAAQRAVERAAEGRLVRTVLHVEQDFALSVHVRPRADEPAALLSVAAREGLC